MTLSVNDVEVAVGPDESRDLAAARELLRQRAIERDLLSGSESDPAAIAAAIEALLDSEAPTPSPTDEECRRYYEAHPGEFRSGDLVHARHILFQVTPHVAVSQLRTRAELTLNDVLRKPDCFAARARELSNCPSGEQGGDLGQIGRGDTVPEFEKALFRPGASGILRELIRTRFGFHVVSIDRNIPGTTLPFESVREGIADHLRARVEEKALRQYVSVLAGQARISGVDLAAAPTPLVQ
ncbi:MAG: peptidylprolyl isomerase [Proteobacteria bacterium]|nr:peptidylprolyl isomerase [Pseudomonadota bacterium]